MQATTTGTNTHAGTQTGRFPFPMPFGWFKVALSGELVADTILTPSYFGTDLVVWRDGDGRPVCQEAYCAHLPATPLPSVRPLDDAQRDTLHLTPPPAGLTPA